MNILTGRIFRLDKNNEMLKLYKCIRRVLLINVRIYTTVKELWVTEFEGKGKAINGMVQKTKYMHRMASETGKASESHIKLSL